MDIGKIYIRSLVGILTAGFVTIQIGSSIEPQILLGLYAAIGGYVLLDRSVDKKGE